MFCFFIPKSSNIIHVNQFVCIHIIDGTIDLSGKTIIPLYDPPHLLKGLRNNLLTKNLVVDSTKPINKSNLVCWETIEKAYQMDEPNGIFKCMRNLTEEHVVKKNIKKMRVKNAAQVLSRTVAGYIYRLAKEGGMYFVLHTKTCFIFQH